MDVDDVVISVPGPGGPWGPTGPVAPVAPVGPAGPCGPIGPETTKLTATAVTARTVAITFNAMLKPTPRPLPEGAGAGVGINGCVGCIGCMTDPERTPSRKGFAAPIPLRLWATEAQATVRFGTPNTRKLLKGRRRQPREFEGRSWFEIGSRSLRADRTPTRKGRSWSKASVSRLLRNPLYVGVLRLGDVVTRDESLRILDDATFVALQELRQEVRRHRIAASPP